MEAKDEEIVRLRKQVCVAVGDQRNSMFGQLTLVRSACGMRSDPIFVFSQ